MGIPGAYLSIARKERESRPACDAVADFGELAIALPEHSQREQASRCMNCGVPFCQSGIAFGGAKRATGCPLHNLIPETNDLLCKERVGEAAARLALTNPFPEFTGRVCPAPCETACNLGLHDEPVTIRDNERAISDCVWEAGQDPLPPVSADARLISVVGSGPAGLTVAWELARRGYRVRIYERDDRPGGLLMYGIPNMKLPKQIIERRVRLMEQSGVEFRCGIDATNAARAIADESDAVVLAIGARMPRRLDVPGAGLFGVHYALDYLTEATKALLDGREARISACGKDVAVIGGGDTGVDCVATALRQGARSVRQIIRSSRPPEAKGRSMTWPGPHDVLAQAYGQAEAEVLFGSDPRAWSTDTMAFVDDGSGSVAAVETKSLSDGRVCRVPAELVLIAKGFIGPEQAVLDAFEGCENVFVAGDARLGSSLVSIAMADALAIAEQVDALFRRY